MPFVMIAGVFILFCLVSEGRRRDTEDLRSLLPVQLPGLPPPVYLIEARRQWLWPFDRLRDRC